MADNQSPVEDVAAPVELVVRIIRSQRVMLDIHLAELYEVPTFRLNQAVKRNSNRFSEDFMFQLTAAEAQSLTSQLPMSRRQEKPVRSEAKEECRKRTRGKGRQPLSPPGVSGKQRNFRQIRFSDITRYAFVYEQAMKL